MKKPIGVAEWQTRLVESLPKKLSRPDWWKRNRAWFEQEVWAKIKASPTTTNVTIKTKSSPP